MPPLERLLHVCVLEPLQHQIKLVNNAVVEYFLDDLKVNDHFATLRRYHLLYAGEFGHVLTTQLVAALDSGVPTGRIATLSTLRAALTQTNQTADPLSEALSFSTATPPASGWARDSIEALDFVQLSYAAPWPVNVVVDDESLAQYNKVRTASCLLSSYPLNIHSITIATRYSRSCFESSAAHLPWMPCGSCSRLVTKHDLPSRYNS